MSVCIFAYALLRAIMLDITYDEAWSIRSFVSISYWDILTFNPCDSNNHMLNSIVVKTLFYVLPESTFVARIPALIGLIVYMFYGWKILKDLNGFVAFIAYSLLLLNPFLMDFFSLARGYGMAFGAEMFAMYLALRFVKERKAKDAFYSLIIAGIATLAVLTLIYFYSSLLLLIVVVSMQKKEGQIKTLASALTATVLLAILLWVPLHKLTQFGNLYYGGKESFYLDTLVSLCKYSMYTMDVSKITFIVLNGILFISGLILVFSFIRKADKVTGKFVFLALLSFCILANFCQVIFFDGYYLIDRTALFLLPPAILMLGCAAGETKNKIARTIPIGILATALLVNMIQHANLNKTITWFFDSHTREILSWLDEKAKKENTVVQLSCSWPFHETLEYYLHKLPDLKVQMSQQGQYYLYLGSGLDKICYYPIQESILQSKNDLLLSFPEESIYLFKRR